MCAGSAGSTPRFIRTAGRTRCCRCRTTTSIGQTDYIYKQPVMLPKGTKIHATAWYDNSTANKSNPDPAKDVTWGDQTWEEMMFTGLTFSIDPPKASNTAGIKN